MLISIISSGGKLILFLSVTVFGIISVLYRLKHVKKTWSRIPSRW